MIIKYNNKEKELLARIMRAEALSEGNLGMLMVGNVVINRILADCLTFKKIDSITDALYQKNQFSGINSPLFFGRPNKNELNLASRILRGEYYFPATNALWFYAPLKNQNCKKMWFNQDFSGRFKNHCFYNPDFGVCKKIH